MADFQMAIHAHSIARLCSHPYAQLILQVTTRHPKSETLQRGMISMLSHASQMSRICSTVESQRMIYTVADKLFHTATSAAWASQEEAARTLIGMISHATSMARIVVDGASEIYATIQAVVDDPLPASAQQIERLSSRLDSVRTEISDIAHRKQMERLIGATLR